MLTITTFIGVIGAVLVLVAFALNEWGKLDHDDVSYDALNAIGGACLAFYAYLLGSVPFLILNLIWTGVAVRDLLAHAAHATKREEAPSAPR